MPNQEDVNVSPKVQFLAGPQDLETGCANLPIEQEDVAEDTDTSEPGHNGNCASMDLAIQSEALSVSLRSRASINAETISLSAQVRLLTDQLAQATMKVDEANYKIGFLEGQLLAARERFEELRLRSGETQPAGSSLMAWLYERLPFASKWR